MRYHILVEELRETRRSAGWTRVVLADRMGIDAQTIKRLERGVGSVPVLIAAMAALDVQLMAIGPGKSLLEQLRKRRRKLSLSLFLDQMATRAALSRLASMECRPFLSGIKSCIHV